MRGNKSSSLLAWCSGVKNVISIIDLETQEEHVNFEGAQLKKSENCESIKVYSGSWKQVKNSNTNLLVSLHSSFTSTNLVIYDISQEGQAKKVYGFEELLGGNGRLGVAYNARRGFLGAISVEGKISYHLFKIDVSNLTQNGNAVRLCRKSKWHTAWKFDEGEKGIYGLDFDPAGDLSATLTGHGECIISEINTNNDVYHEELETVCESDVNGRCKWSTNIGEPYLYIKYDSFLLNVLDAEKKMLTLKTPIRLESGKYTDYTLSIDVCQSNGDLLASGGSSNNIKIFDRRQSKIVREYDKIHRGGITCVRWSPSGDMLASCDYDGAVKLSDFNTGKVVYEEYSSDRSKINNKHSF